jgi:hypothetical protein
MGHLWRYDWSQEVIVVFAVDSALQHTCAEFREQANRGQITEAECDLLIDGAILLAIHLEALIQDAAPAGCDRDRELQHA